MNGNGNPSQGSLPPVELTPEQETALGLFAPDLGGNTIRRKEFDVIVALSVPPHIEMSVSPKERQEAALQLRNMALQMAGKAALEVAIANPQIRLIPIPYAVKSPRHKIDLRIAFWEFKPGPSPGHWGNGMIFRGVESA